MGLLGTVIGVLMAFQIMSESGLTDPSAFAKGISMALITTVGGLVVAIPHYVGHNYLLGMVDNLESDLEKQVLTKII
jgi:biopolymer transport protein ExbB